VSQTGYGPDVNCIHLRGAVYVGVGSVQLFRFTCVVLWTLHA